MPSSKKNKLYALSTCVWCKKTKRLLDKLGVKYEVIYIDLLSEDEEKKAISEVCRWNHDETYPLLIINNKKVICGYDEEKITKEFA
jgi:glutaredoxin-like protein NrdH